MKTQNHTVNKAAKLSDKVLAQIIILGFTLCLSLGAFAGVTAKSRKAKNKVIASKEISSKKVIKASPSKAQPKRSISSLQRETRLKHARQLLGRHYKKSSVRAGEDIKKINGMVYSWVANKLKKETRSQQQKVAQTIIDESLKHGFDPVFLMSVIEGESSWRIKMIGGVGEVGLMQIRPETAEWITGKLDIPYTGEASLYDPIVNIKIGAAFLSYLRERFDDHAQLYIAAYNMGPTNVKRALSKEVWPKDYPVHVMKHYVDFYETVLEKQQSAQTTKSKASKGDLKITESVIKPQTAG